MSAGVTRVAGAAACLAQDGIDTDVIFPARFLLRMEKQGLGTCLFADRADLAGALVRPDGRRATTIVAGAQFGCGSSREHAVWSLVDFGIRVVIAPSFGEIFANNAARNGLAAIVLDEAETGVLMRASAHGDLATDLVARTITMADGQTIGFAMAEGDRQALINGWDEIDIIDAAHHDAIGTFETAYLGRRPWLLRPRAPII